jgi:hypothetical protein
MTGLGRNIERITVRDIKARIDNYRVVMVVVGVFVGTAHIYTVPEFQFQYLQYGDAGRWVSTACDIVFLLKPFFGWHVDHHVLLGYKFKYYIILASAFILLFSIIMSSNQLTIESWSMLVIFRTLGYAVVDTLGEGLMASVKSLEGKYRTMFEEVNHLNIAGVYLFSRGLSRAVFGAFGAYLSAYPSKMQTFYGITALLPIAILIFSKECFYELQKEEYTAFSADHFSQSPSNRIQDDFFSPTLNNFLEIVSKYPVWVHFSVIMVVSVLPIGDIAHRELFAKRTASQSQPELIMLTYINHTILTYGILFYIVTRTTSLNKKHLTVAAFICLILASPPILLMKETSQGMILAWSTLFHLLSHLGHSILTLVFFSLYLPFLSARRTVSLVTLPSCLIKGSTLLQPSVERFITRNLGLEVQFAVYFVMVAILCTLYAVNVEEELDRKVEEALILVRYYEVKRGSEEEEKRLFRPTIEDHADQNAPSVGSSLGQDELEEGYIPDPRHQGHHPRGEIVNFNRGTNLSDESIDLKHF